MDQDGFVLDEHEELMLRGARRAAANWVTRVFYMHGLSTAIAACRQDSERFARHLLVAKPDSLCFSWAYWYGSLVVSVYGYSENGRASDDTRAAMNASLFTLDDLTSFQVLGRGEADNLLFAVVAQDPELRRRGIVARLTVEYFQKTVGELMPEAHWANRIGLCVSPACGRSWGIVKDIGGQFLCNKCADRFFLDAPRIVAPDEPTSAQKERAKLTAKLRWEVMVRDDFRCRACGVSALSDKAAEPHVDHIRPVSKGGLTAPENLQVLCSRCNLGKSADYSEQIALQFGLGH